MLIDTNTVAIAGAFLLNVSAVGAVYYKIGRIEQRVLDLPCLRGKTCIR